MQQVIINAAGLEKRTALLHNGKLVECVYHRPDEKPSAGSIYMGRVQKVLPGMQAVFVDIGTGKNGFLHKDELPAYQRLTKEERQQTSISSLIKEGESVLVQIAKEETGDKGAKLTALLSFTGHLLVYFPFTPHVGISKKIKESNRDLLIKWGTEQAENQEGLIIRTGCEGLPVTDMEKELDLLREQYWELVKRAEKLNAPSLVDKPFFFKTYLERWLSSNVEELIVDDHETHLQLKKYIASFHNPCQLKLYNGKEPIFKHFGIEVEIQKSLSPHVWLKNGSSLYVNVTEALTVIDVNTGKFTGKKDRSQTVANTNIIAAEEIMRQLRLRNLAGMVVIDFITMDKNQDKEKVFATLLKEAKKDASTIILHGFTKMGLFELTRKRERPSLIETLTSAPYGDIMDGRRINPETLFYELDRTALEFSFQLEEAIWLEVPHHLASWLVKHPEKLSGLEKQHKKKLIVTPGTSSREITVRQTGTEKDINIRLFKDSD
jgi:ribonuclease G